jgi:amino acid adenylation domain-containing protein
MRSADRFGSRAALVVDGQQISYADLQERAARIAASIQAHPEFSMTPLTAVLAYRSQAAFSGVLGALLAGNGYVPLNPTFPEDRTRVMFERSGSRSIIVDDRGLSQLEGLLETSKERVLVVLPSHDGIGRLREKWPQHIFAGASDLATANSWKRPAFDPNAVAYLLFTSGSTGIPKGVAVANRNVGPFVNFMADRYGITEHDRLSQMFDMTFDLSVFDMFVCWERGACLYCPSQKTLIKPSKFINENELTSWFSVPSTAMFMKQLGLLKPGQYPSLKWSLFCGEPLPVATASAWLDAAPDSVLENLYGPTELTIACTLYRWDPATSSNEAELGIVPIGYPYPRMKVLVANDSLQEVSPGAEGELLMAGPQMSLGYWKDPEKTAAAFVTPPGQTEVYYRTGDRVRRPMGEGPLVHLGRVDFQVKILGHRVELGEIEVVVREACGLDGVVAVGWPATPGGFGGVEVFIEGESRETESLRRIATAKLPDYMVPRKFHFIDRLPRNVNNKFDRKAMIKLLEEGI